MITLADIEKEVGQPAENWEGQCYAVACAAAKVMNRQGCQGAVPIYGHYQGAVHPSSMFHGKPLQPHGWVLMKNGDVVDPTRWAFEGRKPYIYNGPNDVYDEGGNSFRMATLGSPPPFDTDQAGFMGKVYDITTQLQPEAFKFITELLDLERDGPWTFDAMGCDFGHVVGRQLFWLANYDPRMMQGHATEVFAMLDRLKMKGFVPLDNHRMVEQGRI